MGRILSDEEIRQVIADGVPDEILTELASAGAMEDLEALENGVLAAASPKMARLQAGYPVAGGGEAGPTRSPGLIIPERTAPGAIPPAALTRMPGAEMGRSILNAPQMIGQALLHPVETAKLMGEQATEIIAGLVQAPQSLFLDLPVVPKADAERISAEERAAGRPFPDLLEVQMFYQEELRAKAAATKAEADSPRWETTKGLVMGPVQSMYDTITDPSGVIRDRPLEFGINVGLLAKFKRTGGEAALKEVVPSTPETAVSPAGPPAIPRPSPEAVRAFVDLNMNKDVPTIKLRKGETPAEATAALADVYPYNIAPLDPVAAVKAANEVIKSRAAAQAEAHPLVPSSVFEPREIPPYSPPGTWDVPLETALDATKSIPDRLAAIKEARAAFDADVATREGPLPARLTLIDEALKTMSEKLAKAVEVEGLSPEQVYAVLRDQMTLELPPTDLMGSIMSGGGGETLAAATGLDVSNIVSNVLKSSTGATAIPALAHRVESFLTGLGTAWEAQFGAKPQHWWLLDEPNARPLFAHAMEVGAAKGAVRFNFIENRVKPWYKTYIKTGDMADDFLRLAFDDAAAHALAQPDLFPNVKLTRLTDLERTRIMTRKGMSEAVEAYKSTIQPELEKWLEPAGITTKRPGIYVPLIRFDPTRHASLRRYVALEGEFINLGEVRTIGYGAGGRRMQPGAQRARAARRLTAAEELYLGDFEKILTEDMTDRYGKAKYNEFREEVMRHKVQVDPVAGEIPKEVMFGGKAVPVVSITVRLPQLHETVTRTTTLGKKIAADIVGAEGATLAAELKGKLLSRTEKGAFISGEIRVPKPVADTYNLVSGYFGEGVPGATKGIPGYNISEVPWIGPFTRTMTGWQLASPAEGYGHSVIVFGNALAHPAIAKVLSTRTRRLLARTAIGKTWALYQEARSMSGPKWTAAYQENAKYGALRTSQLEEYTLADKSIKTQAIRDQMRESPIGRATLHAIEGLTEIVWPKWRVFGPPGEGKSGGVIPFPLPAGFETRLRTILAEAIRIQSEMDGKPVTVAEAAYEVNARSGTYVEALAPTAVKMLRNIPVVGDPFAAALVSSLRSSAQFLYEGTRPLTDLATVPSRAIMEGVKQGSSKAAAQFIGEHMWRDIHWNLVWNNFEMLILYPALINKFMTGKWTWELMAEGHSADDIVVYPNRFAGKPTDRTVSFKVRNISPLHGRALVYTGAKALIDGIARGDRGLELVGDWTIGMANAITGRVHAGAQGAWILATGRSPRVSRTGEQIQVAETAMGGEKVKRRVAAAIPKILPLTEPIALAKELASGVPGPRPFREPWANATYTALMGIGQEPLVGPSPLARAAKMRPGRDDEVEARELARNIAAGLVDMSNRTAEERRAYVERRLEDDIPDDLKAKWRGRVHAWANEEVFRIKGRQVSGAARAGYRAGQ